MKFTVFELWMKRCGVCIALLFIALIDDVTAHGGLVDPPGRNIMWREGFDAPVNYDWNALYCGGYNKFKESGGKCGLCGDPYDGPFENDKGGVYDTGIIVRHYPVGLGAIEVKVEITAHHKGYITFKLCPNNEKPLTKSCLDRYPLVIREAQQQGDPYRYRPPNNPNVLEMHVLLPPDVTCDRCVLQWTYTAGNSAGVEKDGRSCVGCGLQETFVNCADISIGGTIDTVPVAGPAHSPAQKHAPTEELVIPQRVDILNMIRSAPPDTPIRDILAMMEGSRTGATTETQRRPQGGQATGSIPPPGTSLRADGIHVKRVGMSPSSSVKSSAMRRGRTNRGQRRMKTVSRSRSSSNDRATSRGRVSSRDRNVSGDRPVSRDRAVRRDKSSSRRSSAKRPRTSSRRSRKRGSRGRGKTGRPTSRSSRQGSSLLESLGRTADEVYGRGLNGLTRESFRPRPSWTTSMPFVETGVSIFGNPEFDSWAGVSTISERVPSGVTWRRGDGRTSPRNAVRNARTFGRMDMPSDVLQQHVPDLPLDILPHQDLDLMQRRRASTLNDNWFPDARTSRRSEMTRSLGKGQRSPDRIPRRIVVHSMAVAQHLLRLYPQLKGRVYLSPEAHARNILYHMAHKYRRRQRWH